MKRHCSFGDHVAICIQMRLFLCRWQGLASIWFAKDFDSLSTIWSISLTIFSANENSTLRFCALHGGWNRLWLYWDGRWMSVNQTHWQNTNGKRWKRQNIISLSHNWFAGSVENRIWPDGALGRRRKLEMCGIKFPGKELMGIRLEYPKFPKRKILTLA